MARNDLNLINHARQSLAGPVELFLVAAGIALCLFLFHSSGLKNNFWLYDDPFILDFALSYQFWEYFFQPDIWALFSRAHFTPLVVTSYSVSNFFNELTPFVFYLHTLISLFILLISFYSALRLYMPALPALAGLSFLIISRPVYASAEILMHRHYIEGGVFALIALILFIVSLRKDSRFFSGLAALCYLISMLCKEVYIPLPLVLLFLPEKSLSKRAKTLLFFAAALGVYLFWRSAMLGTFTGGFTDLNAWLDPISIAGGFKQVISYLNSVLLMPGGFSAYPGLLFLILLCLWGYYITVNGKFRITLFVFAGLLAATIPLLPVSARLSPALMADCRLAFAGSIILSSIMAVTLNSLRDPGPGSASRLFFIAGLASACLIISHLAVANHNWAENQRENILTPLSAETRFIWEHDSSALLIRRDISTGNRCARYLRRLLYSRQHKNPPLVIAWKYGFLSNPDLLDNDPAVFMYDSESKKITAFQGDISRAFSSARRLVRDGDVSVSMNYSQGSFSLNLKTDRPDGGFFALIADYPGVYCDALPLGPGKSFEMSGNFLAGIAMYLRFGWESRDGNTVFLSPEWWVDFRDSASITWQSSR